MTTRQFYKQMLALGFTEAVEKLRKRTKAQWKKCETDTFNRKFACTMDGLIMFIGHMFSWDYSPEGYNYWFHIQSSVCDELRKLDAKT